MFLFQQMKKNTCVYVYTYKMWLVFEHRFYELDQLGPTTGPQMEFVQPAEQFCTSLVDCKQWQLFFLKNTMILG